MSRVEDVKVGVLDSAAIKVGGGIGFCVKWGGILGFSLALSSDQVSFFFGGVKTNILGYLWLILFVKENEGIVTRVTSVEESPSFSRMVRVLQFFAQRWINGDGG